MYAGYLQLGSVFVQVAFSVPLGVTAVQKDSAFLSALSQVTELDYLCLGSDAPPTR